MQYAINPPNTPLIDSRGFIAPEWYRYFVNSKAQGDGITDAAVVTTGNTQTIFPNSRQLEVATGELTKTDVAPDLTLGLANTAVTPATYGAATKLVILAIDAKGRVTGASEVALESGNVTETTKLFFTDARARAALSGAGQINYNSATGVINTTGFSGTGAYTNFTFVNGICTAAS